MFYLGLTPKEGSGFLPGKTFDLLASGRPIVAFTPDDSQVGRLVEGSGRGICFQSGTADKTAQYVLDLIRSVKEGSYQFEPLSDYARQYSSDQLVARFAKVLDGLV